MSTTAHTNKLSGDGRFSIPVMDVAGLTIPGLPTGMAGAVNTQTVVQMVRRAASSTYESWWARVTGSGIAPTRSS